MKPSETVQETERKHLDLMKTYNSAFPNAHFHIAAVPPVGLKQENLNRKLENMTARTGGSFISVQNMYDRNNKNMVRPGILKTGNERHYTETGLRILAKEVKRSLHARNQTLVRQPLTMTSLFDPNFQPTLPWRKPPTEKTPSWRTPSTGKTNQPNPTSTNNILLEMKKLLAQIPETPHF